MRELICLDSFDDAAKITWNPDIPVLSILCKDYTVTFEGKEALKVIAFISSL